MGWREIVAYSFHSQMRCAKIIELLKQGIYFPVWVSKWRWHISGRLLEVKSKPLLKAQLRIPQSYVVSAQPVNQKTNHIITNINAGVKSKQKMKLLTFYLKTFSTVYSKIIRAIEIMLAIFLCFDCQFLSSHAYHKQYKT